MNFSKVAISFPHCMEKHDVKHSCKLGLSESQGLEDTQTHQ